MDLLLVGMVVFFVEEVYSRDLLGVLESIRGLFENGSENLRLLEYVELVVSNLSKVEDIFLLVVEEFGFDV